MAERAIRLPDVGEGVAEAELVEWLVKIGDRVQEDQSLAIVMTDKASVEVPSPVAGEVVWLAAEPGENIAVGSDLVRLRVEGEAEGGAHPGDDAGGAADSGGEGPDSGGVGERSAPESVRERSAPEGTRERPVSEGARGRPVPEDAPERPTPAEGVRERAASSAMSASPPKRAEAAPGSPSAEVPANRAAKPADASAAARAAAEQAMRDAEAGARAALGVRPEAAGAPGARLRPGTAPVLPRPRGEKPIASPAVRARAREAGIDLRRVAGTGPAGRITHEDLDRLFEQGPQAPVAGAALAPDDSVEEIKIVGLRRRIAEKMRVAHERIADMTYVEELDVTDLESLRAKLNEPGGDRPRLTLLPFLMRAIAIAVAGQPRMNAHFDDENGVLRRYGGIHVGIAAQTANGLVVPVVRHVEARDLWSCAAELMRVTDAAKGGTAKREELAGSTITITSLGALGGIVTTPVINHPEVVIVGVNRIAIRPKWDGAAFVPRKMMNLSCSFDHRVVDGWDAAVFVHRLKALLETPALLFVS